METTTAFLIHRFNWRDSSAIGHFLTPAGMQSVILKGVRRQKSRLAAGLQLFVPVRLACFGRTALKTAQALECLTSPPRLDYVQQACGLYANELIHALANEDSGEAVFTAYADFISALPDARGEQLEWAVRHFERQLLAGCGYALSLPVASAQSGKVPASFYCYKPGLGLISCPPGTMGPGVVSEPTLRRFLAGNTDADADLPALKQLMRQCIDDVLGGKKLRSRELLRPILPSTGPKGTG